MFSETLGHLTEKTFSPCVGILTHPGCVVCWAINMYLKKKQNDIPLMQSILFYYTILEAYPTKSQKVDSSKNPAQFLVAIFGFFRKKKTPKTLCSKGNLPTNSSHRFHYQVTELGFEDSEGSDFWRRAPDVWGSLKTPTRSPPGKSR